MIEDDNYRTSSQYRFWSFTAAQLDQRRTETNRYASEKVRAAFSRARSGTLKDHGQKSTTAATDSPNTKAADPTIDTLTTAEELRIIQWGCEKIIAIKSILSPSPPSFVIGTAIQFLRRFYLANSPMTYHPKQIMICALFLATKSCHFYIDAGKLSSQLGVATEEFMAPEFLLMQALRFTLDIRHPMRGLEGGIAEIRLRSAGLKCFESANAGDIKKRIDVAGDKSRRLLVHDVQMTDAYFLYTPSQIWLAALLIVDEQLTLDYIEHLFSRLGTAIGPIKRKLIDTIEECAGVIKSYRSPEDDEETERELKRIGRKLKKCQDPEKVDMVAVVQEKKVEKREGTESDAERRAKKRKMGKEQMERDGDVFGPDLRDVKKVD